MSLYINFFCPYILIAIIRYFKTRKAGSSPEHDHSLITSDNANATYYGIYGTWEDAKKHSEGYDSKALENILLNNALQVKRGAVAFGRDGISFSNRIYYEPYISLFIELRNKNKLREEKINILDFGGGLGATFFQYRDLFREVVDTWTIVEQKNLVNIGNSLIANDLATLNFIDDINKAPSDISYDIVILSSVLPYLPNPQLIISDILKLSPKIILLTRHHTYQSSSSDDNHKEKEEIRDGFFAIHQVPPDMYNASYPIYLSTPEFWINLFPNYKVIFESDNLPPDGIEYHNILHGKIIYSTWILEKI